MNFLRKNPMLPAVTALAVGTLFAGWRIVPLWLAILLTALLLLLAVVGSFSRAGRADVATLLSLMFLGVSLSQMHNQLQRVSSERMVYTLTADSPLNLNGGWWRGEARLESACDESGVWHRASGRVRLYADSALRIDPPSRLMVSTRILPFRDSTGRYSRAMHRKGYVGVVFVRASDLLDVAHDTIGGVLLPRMHLQAVERVGRLELPPMNLALAEALATGERGGLSADVRKNYSLSGVAHVLALSGLHVGMVLLVVNALFWWLPLLRRGHRIRNVAVILLLWVYMFMTGLSPSALRAALMFSLLQLSLFRSDSYSGINSLSTAAFISLCWNPNLIYDAGFQLSYIAVAAILLWGVPMCQKLRLTWSDTGRIGEALQRVANALISTIIIGFVATIATAPLISHMFGVVSIVGVVLNPLIVAISTIAVGVLVVWLFLPLEPLNWIISLIVRLSTDAMNMLAGWFADEPWATLEIRLSGMATVALYALMVVLTIVVSLFYERKGRQMGAKMEKIG